MAFHSYLITDRTRFMLAHVDLDISPPVHLGPVVLRLVVARVEGLNGAAVPPGALRVLEALLDELRGFARRQ